jgi:cell division protein ZapD
MGHPCVRRIGFVKKKITYEQPLNERMKQLLRIEYLFSGIHYSLKAPSAWDSRHVVSLLLDILELLGRNGDLKADLAHDLEHHAHRLERWQNTPNVDTQRVTELLGGVRTALAKLSTVDGVFGEEMLNTPHNLFTTLRQRASIAGGTCRFDVPNYHHWLQRSPKQRLDDLSEWLMPLEIVREAVDLNLYMIRNNAQVSQETANMGFFQSKLDANLDYQLIRISLPLEHACYPEISGGKQRFTIRFFEQTDMRERPLQTEQDVNFELCCCMM